jgi:hypothetical protein
LAAEAAEWHSTLLPLAWHRSGWPGHPPHPTHSSWVLLPLLKCSLPEPFPSGTKGKKETNSSSKETQEVKGYKDSKLCSKFQTSASLFLLGKKNKKKPPTETVWWKHKHKTWSSINKSLPSKEKVARTQTRSHTRRIHPHRDKMSIK